MSAIKEYHEFVVTHIFTPPEGSTEKPIINISCPCGDVDSMIDDLMWLPSVESRHFLLHDVWPFVQPKFVKKKKKEEE